MAQFWSNIKIKLKLGSLSNQQHKLLQKPNFQKSFQPDIEFWLIYLGISKYPSRINYYGYSAQNIYFHYFFSVTHQNIIKKVAKSWTILFLAFLLTK